MFRGFQLTTWSVVTAGLLLSSGTIVSDACASTSQDGKDGRLDLFARRRVAVEPQSGAFRLEYQSVHWDANKTAVIVCDMWARHWCDGAHLRGGQMAPRMNDFIIEARRRGALIVHAPSGGMAYYDNHPARLRAKNAPRADNLPQGIAGWCRGIASEPAGKWPIDQEDGGCDDRPNCPNREMDRHQTAAIVIDDQDAISDSGEEIWNLFEQRGIENVILVGVHVNMCVVGRPFGLRNMVRCGKNVLLVRDLTDAMYNSRCRPFVTHIRGTELVVEHIEKYVCPTITSTDLLDRPANRFAEDKRPHVAFLVSDDHYDADKKLPQFAQMLREKYGCHCTVLHGQGTANFPLTAELPDVDCLVLFIRRLAPPAKQLDRIRRYLNNGGALVALRTASHAFDTHGKHDKGHAEWPEFDAQILGGNYHNHGPNERGTDVHLVSSQAGHSILKGVGPSDWHSVGSLYFTSPLAPGATVLMTGTMGDQEEPLTWTRQDGKSRVFYTALGHPEDFQHPGFRQLLVNAVFWSMDRSISSAP